MPNSQAAPPPHPPATDKEAATPRLEDQLCFSLYAASRTMTNLYRPLLDALGLTYPQYLVMLVLWERRSATVGDLVSALQLDYGTLTPLLKRLEAAHLIERRRRADDERVVEVVLTGPGADLEARISTIPSVIGDAMGLEMHEIDLVRDLVKRLTTNVNRTIAARD